MRIKRCGFIRHNKRATDNEPVNTGAVCNIWFQSKGDWIYLQTFNISQQITNLKCF